MAGDRPRSERGSSLTALLMAMFVMSLLVAGVIRSEQSRNLADGEDVLARYYQFVGDALQGAGLQAGTPAQWVSQGILPEEVVSASGALNPDDLGVSPVVSFYQGYPLIVSGSPVPVGEVNEIQSMRNMGLSTGGPLSGMGWSAPLPPGVIPPGTGTADYGYGQ